jgi:signal transduction histidine kinase/DNA-binding NarL/FixJ family response regulator
MTLKTRLFRVIFFLSFTQLIIMTGFVTIISSQHNDVSIENINIEYQRIINFHINNIASNINIGDDEIIENFLNKIAYRNTVNIHLSTQKKLYEIIPFKINKSSYSEKFKLTHAGAALGEITFIKEVPSLTKKYKKQIITFILFQIFIIVTLLLSFYFWTSRNILRPFKKSLMMASNGESFNELENKHLPIELNNLLESLKVAVMEGKEKCKIESVALTTRMLAHDINRPFTKLEFFLKALSKSKTLESYRKNIDNYVPDLMINIGTIEAMLSNMINLNHNTKLVTETVSIKKLFRNSLALVSEVNTSPQLIIEDNIPSDSYINVNKLELIRVFSNIIENATQAMNGIGVISLSLNDNKTDEYYEIYIKNTNSSLTQDEIKKIFGLFFTKGKVKGSGLGLSIVKQIVEKHGGSVNVVSDESSVCFKIKLKKCKRNTETMTMELNQEDEDINKIIRLLLNMDRKLNILSVDDEIVYFEHIKDLINDDSSLSSYVNIDYAPNSTSAITYAQKNSFDLLFCDIDLNEAHMNGVDVSKELRKLHPGSQIAIHSNRRQKDSEIIEESQANYFIPKPLKKKQLIEIILKTVQKLRMNDIVMANQSLIKEEQQQTKGTL